MEYIVQHVLYIQTDFFTLAVIGVNCFEVFSILIIFLKVKLHVYI